MQSIEVSGKSLNDAKMAAAKKLGVEAEALSVTVLEETKGLFGKGGVRIRAEVGSAAVEAPAKPKGRGRAAKPVAEAPPEPEPEPEIEAEVAAPEEAPKPRSRGRAPKKAGADEPAVAASRDEDREPAGDLPEATK